MPEVKLIEKELFIDIIVITPSNINPYATYEAGGIAELATTTTSQLPSTTITGGDMVPSSAVNSMAKSLYQTTTGKAIMRQHMNASLLLRFQCSFTLCPFPIDICVYIYACL
ncbi:unnamed protein product [Protopolystoma xenopodis]|uniref:Uncharacterized protein n=1 Tax=Protopolystoma xenopodis TaxID=117903 RepID=A0A3S5FEJ1_9PLAT|nr:unnamed protein product [Protopolystoma xenopodis]